MLACPPLGLPKLTLHDFQASKPCSTTTNSYSCCKLWFQWCFGLPRRCLYVIIPWPMGLCSVSWKFFLSSVAGQWFVMAPNHGYKENYWTTFLAWPHHSCLLFEVPNRKQLLHGLRVPSAFQAPNAALFTPFTICIWYVCVCMCVLVTRIEWMWFLVLHISLKHCSMHVQC